MVVPNLYRHRCPNFVSASMMRKNIVQIVLQRYVKAAYSSTKVNLLRRVVIGQITERLLMVPVHLQHRRHHRRHRQHRPRHARTSRTRVQTKPAHKLKGLGIAIRSSWWATAARAATTALRAAANKLSPGGQAGGLRALALRALALNLDRMSRSADGTFVERAAVTSTRRTLG